MPEHVGRVRVRPPVLEEPDSRSPSRLVALQQRRGHADGADALAVASSQEGVELGGRIPMGLDRPAERRRQRERPVRRPHDVLGGRWRDLEHGAEQVRLRLGRERELHVAEVGGAERGEASWIERLLAQPRHRVPAVVRLGPKWAIEPAARAGGTTTALDDDLESLVGEGVGDQSDQRASPVGAAHEHEWCRGVAVGDVVIGEQRDAVRHRSAEVLPVLDPSGARRPEFEHPAHELVPEVSHPCSLPDRGRAHRTRDSPPP